MLKQVSSKVILNLLACVLLVTAFMRFAKGPSLAIASAKIRIESKLADNGQSLLETQVKAITQQSTMEELLRRIKRLQPDDLAANQRLIYEIQKAIQVIRQGKTEIFEIQVRHQDAKFARQIATYLPLAFQTVSMQEESQMANSDLANFSAQISALRQELELKENRWRELREQNTLSDIDVALRDKLLKKQAAYQEMLNTYTPQHPDVVELKKQIEDLKLQLLDGPSLDLSSVKAAEEDFRKTESEYRNLRQRYDDLTLEKGKISSRIQILEINSAASRYRPQNRYINLLLWVALSIIVFILASRLS